MEFKDFIRICALRSNAHWPFSILNKTPCFVAIRAFSIFCKRFQEISGAYVRNRLVGASWIPGLSDIDLTIVIRKDLDLERVSVPSAILAGYAIRSEGSADDR